MKERNEPLTEVLPLRISKTMLAALRNEATQKFLPVATYVRQILGRRNGSK